jgi:hypothetical protein
MLRSSGHGAGLVCAGWLGGGARCGLPSRGTFGPGSDTLFGTEPRGVAMPVRLDRDANGPRCRETGGFRHIGASWRRDRRRGPLWVFSKDGSNPRRRAPDNLFHETDLY